MAHGDAREGKWRGNWRMEWVASILTLPRNVVYPALLPLMRTPRLPAVDWTDAPSANLNKLVRFGERRNPVSARLPSRFKRTVPVVARNGGNAYWKSAPTYLFIWHQVTRLLRSAYESQRMGRDREGVENITFYIL